MSKGLGMNNIKSCRALKLSNKYLNINVYDKKNEM